MKTMLLIKLALLLSPLLYVGGSLLGHPAIGAGLGFAYSTAWTAISLRRGVVRPIELALWLGLAVVASGYAAGLDWAPRIAHAALMLSLAGGAGASIVVGRPWTAEYSASEWRGAAAHPLFRQINTMISVAWAVIFAWVAVAELMDWPALAHWLPVGAGGLLSGILPPVLVRRNLARMARGDVRNTWPAPDFVAGRATPVAGDTAAIGAAIRCDVAVIGAGLGGLAAAALLADAGLRVEVFEQHDVPGGFAHTWLRRARGRDPVSGQKLVFRFDSGVHDVSGWQPGGPVRAVFERLSIADTLTWHRLDHRYAIDGRTLDVPRDWRAYAARLGELYPDERAGIAALFEETHAIFTAMYSTAAQHGGIPGMPRTAEGLLAFVQEHPLAVAWMDRPWREFVARHLVGEGPRRWVSALTGYVTDAADVAKVADIVPLFGYYFHGGYYPEGGSGRIAEALVEAIAARGGAVRLRHRVDRIVVANGRAAGLMVRDHRGGAHRVDATAVVSNADLIATLSRLVDDPQVGDLVGRQLGAVRPSCSAFGVHLGVRGELDLPGVLLAETADGRVAAVVPSAADRSAAPPGFATLELLTLVTNDEARTWFAPAGAAPAGANVDLEAWRRSPEYAARKHAFGDRLIARARALIPDLEQRIVYRCDASPVTFRRYAWTTDGAIYGVKPASAAVPVRSPLRNLVVAGAATHGPGVEAVFISGALAAEALVPDLLARAAGPAARRALAAA